MTKRTTTEYECDVTGQVIEDKWDMLTVTLQQSHRHNVQIQTSPPQTPTGETEVHIHPDAYDTDVIKGNREPRDYGITAFVTDCGEIPMIRVNSGARKRYFGGSGMPPEWESLARTLENEVLEE